MKVLVEFNVNFQYLTLLTTYCVVSYRIFWFCIELRFDTQRVNTDQTLLCPSAARETEADRPT